ncbi:hypothetical protein ATG98_3814 [Marinobacter sp. LV10R520-4]|uniref:hypothetical protein n=1 Tax=Marinobacter sp. LV10R520-4 TaxID=1761796 RepID=UPI000BF9B2DE|nr:hypothetical protein [Marinobacter sp. LV10R520-4]PFG54550.1 hypothetical protein ATG98_3814 [Marinobacter sp. LV10R520-4]
MAALDKDLYQKESAVRFCLINGLIPFLEVDVLNFRELSETETVITDFDVLGVKIEPTGQPQKILFDCKTSKVSPINRAFWASGLMQYAGCDEAFVLLRRKASEAHRLSAKTINVHLFDDSQFSNYAESCSIDFNVDYCYSTKIDNWVSLFNAKVGNNHFEQCFKISNINVPLEKDVTKVLRQLITAFQKSRGEFDPAKSKHRAIFYHATSSFAFLMAQIIHDLRNVVDFDAELDDFERVVRFYIWGGRDSLRLRNKLKSAFASQNKSLPQEEAEFNGWPMFVELCRSLLDSPADIQKCVNPLRELAMRSVTPIDEKKDAHLSSLIASNKRIRQFSMSLVRYFVTATKLPSEFISDLDKAFDDLR